MGFIERLLGEEPSLFDQWGHDDKGEYAEFMLEFALSNNNVNGYTKVLKNLYIPYYNRTVEIDLVLLTEKFIFVYESKNYSGWIFGSAENKYWTQMINKNTKNRFYNPILQNETHIKALSKLLKIPTDKFKSFIVFSQRCELKKVPEHNNRVKVIKRGKTIDETNLSLSFEPKSFSIEIIDRIHKFLSKYENASEETKNNHINNINKMKK